MARVDYFKDRESCERIDEYKHVIRRMCESPEINLTKFHADSFTRQLNNSGFKDFYESLKQIQSRNFYYSYRIQ